MGIGCPPEEPKDDLEADGDKVEDEGDGFIAPEEARRLAFTASVNVAMLL
jgi:hypothetical protein